MSFREAVFAAKKATVLRSSASLAAELIDDARLASEELEALQRRRAAAQAKFAMQHTEFYRDLYSGAGFRVEDLDDPAAFAELPTISKQDLRDNPKAFVSSEATPANSKRSTTGGSTGEPLSLQRDLRFPARALEWRLFDWWGVSPADDIALVSRHVKSEQESRLHRLQWWPSRRFQLDAFTMDKTTIDGFLRQWQRIRPRVMIGYVGAIAELAAGIADQDGPLPHPPAAIAVTAAPLNANQRALIERVFRAPVYDHYRSAEVPWIAGECTRRDGLHVFADVRVLELIDEDGHPTPTGQTGEVVVSDLTNRVFPLLRYRIGDRASYTGRSCRCGVTLPLISPVAGRVTEILHLPNDQSVAGEGLAQIFSATPEAVRQFQIRQRVDYSIDLRVVAGPGDQAKATIETATAKFRQIVRDAVPVRLEYVDSIPHDGGKVRYLVSDVVAPRSIK